MPLSTVITVPPTLSPGRLAIFYITDNLTHQASTPLTAGVDINDLVALRADAVQLGEASAALMQTHEEVQAWGVLTYEGIGLYREAFPTAIVGSHSSPIGSLNYESARVAINGKARPGGLLQGGGRTLYGLYTLSSYPITPGEKLIATPDTVMQDLINILDSSSRFFADFYGQECSYTGRTTVQFDAHVQRTYGA